MDDVPVNIKDYIIKARQAGQTDSEIIISLEKTHWPDDIIQQALREADAVIPPVPEKEPEQDVEQQPAAEKQPKNQEKQIQQPAKEDIKEARPKKQKKGFCFLTLIALLFSWLPFVGLGLAMTSFDIIRKKNKSGTLLALAALVLNICSILFVIYILINLFTLPPDQLEGISLKIVEMLDIF